MDTSCEHSATIRGFFDAALTSIASGRCSTILLSRATLPQYSAFATVRSTNLCRHNRLFRGWIRYFYRLTHDSMEILKVF